jgi:hypothetical protein
MTYFNLFKTPYMDIADDFGGGSDESLNTNVDEGQEGKNVDLDGEGTGEVDSQANEKPKQDRDTNEQFKAARVAAEKEAQALKGKQDTFAKKFGYSSFEEMEQAEAEREAKEAEEQQRQYYQSKGIDPEAVNQLIDEHPMVKQAKEITAKTRIATEKAALASKPFFAECEADVDKILAINPDLPVELIFNNVRGQKLDELLAKSDSNAVKRTIADIHDRKSRGLTSSSDSEPEPEVELSAEGKKMAAAFGNDPKEIAKYVKKQIKK